MARNLAGPEELLAGLNRKLNQELEPGMFVTMFAMALEPESGTLEFANAGHPVPLLRQKDGSVVELGEHGALPLGAMTDSVFRQRSATLAAGSCVLLYTDGLDKRTTPEDIRKGSDWRSPTGRSAQAALDAAD